MYDFRGSSFPISTLPAALPASTLIYGIQQFSTFLQQNLPQLFALLMEPYAMIQVSILLQLLRTVIANFIPGNFAVSAEPLAATHETPFYFKL